MTPTDENFTIGTLECKLRMCRTVARGRGRAVFGQVGIDSIRLNSPNFVHSEHIKPCALALYFWVCVGVDHHALSVRGWVLALVICRNFRTLRYKSLTELTDTPDEKLCAALENVRRQASPKIGMGDCAGKELTAI